MQIDWIKPSDNLTLKPSQVDVWRVSIMNSSKPLRTTLPSDLVQWAESIISTDEAQRASRFRFETDRRRFIVSHASLRDILVRYLARLPEDVQFGTGEHGRPVIIPNTRLNFNLSHSGDFALIAVTNGHKVGIDVEKVRNDIEHEKIASRFFSERENLELQQLPNQKKIAGFFNCWTRKEAYVKAHGLGLLLPLADFDVSLVPDEPAILLATRPEHWEASRWTIHSLGVHPEYAGAVAVEGRGMEFRFWEWDPIR